MRIIYGVFLKQFEKVYNIKTEALRVFGKPRNMSEVSYIFPDGTLIGYGGLNRFRDKVHAEIAASLLDFSPAKNSVNHERDDYLIYVFLKETGCVRVSFLPPVNSSEFFISFLDETKLTEKQLEAMIDISNYMLSNKGQASEVIVEKFSFDRNKGFDTTSFLLLDKNDSPVDSQLEVWAR